MQKLKEPEDMMASDQNRVQQLQAEIDRVQQQLDERNEEANRLKRQLGMAEQAGRQGGTPNVKGQGGDIQASTQHGRVQEVEEEIIQLQQRLDDLRTQSTTQGSMPPRQEPVAQTSELSIGRMAWMAQTGGVSRHLHTAPTEESGTIDRLTSGIQMTILDGPAQADGHTWWRVRTTEGREGWVAEDGLQSIAV